jgi:small subunit ribosomal protein S3
MIDKPGIVIGRSGEGIKELKAALEAKTGKTVNVELVEVKRAEMDAQLSAESIAQALEKRISFRRAMKQAIQRTMKANAKGIKVLVSGRLGGAEIARNEKYSEGNVPLHTLRANISYGFAEADTQYGKIGVKVWINLGERLEKGLMSSIPEVPKNDRRDGKGGRGRRDDRNRRDRNSGGFGGRGRNRRDDKNTIPKAVNPRKRKAPKKDSSKVSTAEDREAAAKVEEASKIAAEATEAPTSEAPVQEPAKTEATEE